MGSNNQVGQISIFMVLTGTNYAKGSLYLWQRVFYWQRISWSNFQSSSIICYSEEELIIFVHQVYPYLARGQMVKLVNLNHMVLFSEQSELTH